METVEAKVENDKDRLKIDFELRRDRPAHTGLTIALRPEATSAVSVSPVWISENAFGFLEPRVQRRCSQYGKLSHWGVTRVCREEWFAVIEDWQRLVCELERAETPGEYNQLVWFFSEEAKLDFSDHFDQLKADLSVLINKLHEWIHSTLATHQCILIEGI
ncbi:MAG: hypothetical protein ABSH09_23935 [Bryobacteraceae bacterium]